MSVFFVGVGIASATTTAAPTVSTNTWAGQTLVAMPVTQGDALEWWQCDANGANCVDTGTSGPDSPAVAAGDTYYVVESGTTPGDSATTAPATSSPPTPDPAPSVSGRDEEGDTLTYTPGVWDPSGSTDAKWERCNGSGTACTAFLDATANPTYRLTASDVGDTFEVVETETYTPQSQLTANSNVSTPVSPAPPSYGSGIGVAGVARQGETLTAEPGSWSAIDDDSISYTYQWLQCSIGCSEIAGATGQTYQLNDMNVGSSLAVIVRATTSTGGTATEGSPRTAIVTATTATSVVAFATSANVNEPVKLEAFVTSSADTADPSGTVAFLANGTTIPGCGAVPVTGAGQGIAVSCSASFAAGSDAVSATFSPGLGAPLAGSTGAGPTIAVSTDATTLTLDVPLEALRRQMVTYTVSVSPADDLTGEITPGGAVRFLDNGRTIRGCGQVAVSDGGATCTTRYRDAGTQRISAHYDGDANFRAASSSRETVHILRALPRLTVTATMQWTFHYTPGWTRILALKLHGVVADARVTLSCDGHGCPFRTHARTMRAARPTLNLAPGFHGRRLDVATRVVVEVTRAHYVGKYYRFTIRARHQPTVLISCLAPGSKRPGVGCRR